MLLLGVLAGCGGPPAPDTAAAEVQRVLDRRATAVLDRDEAAYRATEEPSGSVTEFRRLRAVPLAAWAYHLTDLRRSGDRATADAELRYRVEGYDRAPVTVARTLRLVHDDGRWRVASDAPHEEGRSATVGAGRGDGRTGRAQPRPGGRAVR